MHKLGNFACMHYIDLDTVMQINCKSALMKDMSIVLVKMRLCRI